MIECDFQNTVFYSSGEGCGLDLDEMLPTLLRKLTAAHDALLLPRITFTNIGSYSHPRTIQILYSSGRVSASLTFTSRIVVDIL